MARRVSNTGLMQRLGEWRKRIAPAGTLREQLARALYVPILRLVLPPPPEQADRLRPMVAQVVFIGDLGTRAFQYTRINSIVIFKLDHIGDFIVGLRAMRMIREGFAGARITLVCASWNAGWARQLGLFDEVVTFDFFSRLNRDWNASPQDLAALYDRVRELPLGAFDLAVDLRHDGDTRPCLYRVAAGYRAGFDAPPQEGMPYLDLNLPVAEGGWPGADRAPPVHAELRLELLASAVVAAFGPRRPHPLLHLAPTAGEGPAGAFAVLAIGAGDPIRCWPIERYAQIGGWLIETYGLDIVVLGGEHERADAAYLQAAMPAGRVRCVLDQPLEQLPPLLARGALCVCNGSGVSHLAAALEVPTVCVLGGTTRMDVWHPAGANVISVGGRTPCQPCGLKQASDCAWNVACLTSVTTAHVIEACERLLPGRTNSGLTAGRAAG